MDAIFGVSESDAELELRWTRILDDTKAQTIEMHTLIKKRSCLLDNGEEAAQISAQARRGVSKVRAQVGQLERLLRQMEEFLSSDDFAMGKEEVARLAREVAVLEEGLRKGQRPREPGVRDDSDRTPDQKSSIRQKASNLNADQLQQLQQKALNNQDSQLDQLSKHMLNLKGISTTINNEIIEQNQILDEFDQQMGSTSGKLETQKQKLQEVEDASMCLIS